MNPNGFNRSIGHIVMNYSNHIWLHPTIYQGVGVVIVGKPMFNAMYITAKCSLKQLLKFTMIDTGKIQTPLILYI